MTAAWGSIAPCRALSRRSDGLGGGFVKRVFCLEVAVPFRIERRRAVSNGKRNEEVNGFGYVSHG